MKFFAANLNTTLVSMCNAIPPILRSYFPRRKLTRIIQKLSLVTDGIDEGSTRL